MKFRRRDIYKKRSLSVLRSRRFRVGAVFVSLGLIGLSIFIPASQGVMANARGDGVLAYGVAANTTPQRRTYSGASNSFSSAGGTVAGATPFNMTVRASSTKQEMIAGYTSNGGVLQIMCFNGTTWSNEWTVTVGGTGNTQRFDIAYETNTGDVMVLYSGNVGTTNELAYRTKAGSSGCGSANWSAATNLTAAQTNGTVHWVRMAWDKRGSSDLIAAIWADSASDLSASIWSGSAWGNEPTALLEGNLEIASFAADVKSFDVEYESSSGDVLIVWSTSGTGTTNLIKYTACTGGTAGCTWPSPTLVSNVPTVADAGTNLDIAAHPTTDEVSMVAIDNGGGANSCDLSAGHWSGSAWIGQANIDTSAECPTFGQQVVATAWLVSGGTSRRILTYDDSTGTGISYKYADGAAGVTSPADFAATPAINDVRSWYDMQTDPFNPNRVMLTVADSATALFAKQVTLDGAGNFTWSNADGGAAITSTLAQASGGASSFAYWRATSTFEQAAYGWFANADNVQPGSALASLNSAATIASNSVIVRLRLALTVGTADMDAGSQAFKLQYATSTSGPWTDLNSAADTWCNDTTGITCTTSWSARKKITLNNTASSENLADFPLLVKLNSSRIDYAKTQNSGEDLRFVDPSDPSVVLPHEIESWNEAGDSYVWIKVPQVDSASNSDYIFMYYGNASASDGQSASAVWNSGYGGVWHMKENPTTVNCPTSKNICDSTTNANNATTSGSMAAGTQVTGKINGALDFDGSNDAQQAPDSNSLDLTGTLTLSGWIRMDASSGAYKTIFIKEDASANANYALQLDSFNFLDFSFFAGGSYRESISSTSLSTSTLYYVAATYSDSANEVRLYINGALNATRSETNSVAANTSTLLIGVSRISGNEAWNGLLDELRVSNVVRSGEWIEAEYANQNDTMASFGTEQDQSADDSEGIWRLYGNPTPAHGATITSTLLTGSTVAESYQEASPTPANPNAVPIGGRGEWDFALDPAGVCGGTYYFRMVKSDGTTLGTYSVYPQIIVDLPQIVPTDKALRHGAWFDAGEKQPYGCEWVDT